MPSTWAWPMEKQHPDLVLPNTWDSLDSFVNWYMEQRKPIIVPWNAEVIRTDHSTAACLFKHDCYQVEMYLTHPYQRVPKHAHPGMEVITILGGGGSSCGGPFTMGASYRAGRTADLLREGEFHGGQRKSDNGDGYVLFSFERFLRGNPPISAAVYWKGETEGRVHNETLGKHWPQANILPYTEYFDATPFIK
jgi:hypothetical protein